MSSLPPYANSAMACSSQMVKNGRTKERYDPECLAPSLPESRFAVALDEATMISIKRYRSFLLLWKLKKVLNIGSVKKLSIDVTEFFWLLSKNPNVESKILNEILSSNNHTNEDHSIFNEMKSMEYTYAALCESMRLYPPVLIDTKEAARDDVLPDGTEAGEVADSNGTSKRMYVPKDANTYPVFHAGPRACLGKEMAFLQMKRIVAGVLGRFRVVPALEDGVEPVYVPSLTAVMKDGFPVRVKERCDHSYLTHTDTIC
ncbi:hypothetical protein Droror1_Dr00025127 [Drosera rotundifolia]